MKSSNAIRVKTEEVISFLFDKTHKYKSIVFANSLGADDMVLTDIICTHSLDIDVITLDTGRLHEETYSLLKNIGDRYAVPVKVYYPDTKALENFVMQNGINAFYDSFTLRKNCCQIRKVEPLKRALKNRDGWVTGLRQNQSITREEIKPVEWDDHFQLYKFNPLYNWSSEDVWNYIHHFKVPYNALHDNDFPSIGCEPCTRPVKAGEDIRAGRWWWEDPTNKECGLHQQTHEKDKVEVE